MLNDHHGFLPSGRIQFVIHRHALDNIVEHDLTALFRQNRHIVRIPLHKGFAFLDGFPVSHGQHGADRNIIILDLRAGLGIKNSNPTVLVQHNVAAIFKAHNSEAFVFQHTTFAGDNFRLLKDGGRRTPNVEGPHGQLRARLTNRLGSNDADGLTVLGSKASGQVATVAVGTHTLAHFAGEHRTHLHLFDVGVFDGGGFLLVNLFTGAHEEFVRVKWIDHIFAGVTTHETVGQMHDLFFAFINGFEPNTVVRPTISHLNDYVLRHIDQLSGHIPGVGRLECGIRQAFTRAVRGDEVLQHGEAFAEV